MTEWEIWSTGINLQFDHPKKWYMYKPESVQENETHKILFDFEITESRSEDLTWCL